MLLLYLEGKMKKKKREEKKKKEQKKDLSRQWYENYFSGSDWGEKTYHIVYLICISLIVYSNSLRNSFQLDDFHTVLNNPAIRYIHPLWRHFFDPSTMTVLPSNISYRPLMPLSLSFTYAIFGYNVIGYHIFNLFVHISTAVILYFLFIRLLSFHSGEESLYCRIIAFLASLMFSIHPLSGFCVNYICGRDNPMMMAFLMLSFYIYAGMRKNGETIRGWTAVVLLFLLSLMCKPTAVVFPLVILVFEIFMTGSPMFSKGTIYRVWIFGLTVTVVFLFVKFCTPVFEITHGFIGSSLSVRLTYLMTQFKLHLFHYLRNFIWPFPIRGLPTCEVVKSPLDIMMISGFLVVAGSIFAAYFFRRKTPLISFSILAYWIMFIPTSSVLPVYQYVADRWMYPSLPYLCLITAIIIIRYIPRPKISLIILIILILYFGIASFFMNFHWKNSLSFYKQCAKYGTDEIGYMNLGLSYRGVDEEKARFYMEKSLERNPNYYLASINLGLWYIDHGEEEKGLSLTKKGVDLTPAGCEPYSYYWYGKALENTGKPEEAFKVYEELIDLSSGNPDMRHLYDAALAGQNIQKYKEALKYLDMIHERTKNYKESRFTAGWCYQSLGEYEKALREYDLAIKYTPECSQTYANMGYLFKDRGDYEKALEYFEKYLKFVPDDEGVKEAVKECEKFMEE